MSLRLKISLSFAALAAVAAIIASTLSYNASRNQLYKQIDQSLASTSKATVRALEDPLARQAILQQGAINRPPDDITGNGALGNQLFATQYVSAQGIIVLSGRPQLPVTASDLRLAKLGNSGPTQFSNIEVEGERLRMASTPVTGGGVAQIARSSEDVAQTLDQLRTKAISLTIIIVLVAGFIGFLIASSVTRPLERLTRSAERVAASGQPDAEITVDGRDEIGRLGRVLQRMLASLSQSRNQQERLVQDAGHELRTPLTAITTNIAVLQQFNDIDPQKREQILAALSEEATEMGQIINDLVELTTIGEDEAKQPIDLDQLVEQISEQASRRFDRQIEISGQAGQIEGRPRALRHAVFNLLDNAAKFDRSDKPLIVKLTKDNLVVEDNGPGIPEGSEELIFERFHRTVETRSEPGSGLGLSIVAEVARLHGGRTMAGNRPDGGAAIGFSWNN